MISPTQRACLKWAILAACREMIRHGTIPSETLIYKRVRGCGVDYIRRLRAELVAEGLLDWSHLPKFIRQDGLAEGREPTEAERKQIDAARQEILDEKIARGEFPERRRRILRVYRCPSFGRKGLLP